MNANLEKQIFDEGKRLFEKHKVKEIQRQKQQGLGRPVISIEHKGYRFVAVGNRLHYGKWKTFVDFLTDYLKVTLGSQWGNTEIAKPLADRHPLMQWYDKVCRLQAAHAKEPGVPFSTPVTGAVSAYNRLAYNLYLIAHNGKDIQTRLIARLKDRGNFQGAFFETQVAAWLIKAGFELEFEDERDTSSSHCEFTATYLPTGEKYSVEAKSRETKPGGSARTPVGNQLGKALKKKASHKRLVFLDLNKSLLSHEVAERAVARAEYIISQSENLQIDGQPAPPAYVCITNMSDQYALDTTGAVTVVSFVGYKIADFTGVEFPSIREAVRARDRHLPMFQLLKSIEEHREIPQTFGGELPSEVFVENSPARLQIGNIYVVPGPDGSELTAKLTSATVMNGKTYAVLQDQSTGVSWIGTFDMTPEELADHENYRETYFGVHEKSGRKIETALEMFDWLFETYRHTPKEKLIELMEGTTPQQGLQDMEQNELAEILCERYVMHMVSNGFAVNTPRGRRRGPPSK